MKNIKLLNVLLIVGLCVSQAQAMQMQTQEVRPRVTSDALEAQAEQIRDRQPSEASAKQAAAASQSVSKLTTLRRMRAPLAALGTSAIAVSCGVAAFCTDDHQAQDILHGFSIALGSDACAYAGYKLWQKIQLIKKEHITLPVKTILWRIKAPLTAILSSATAISCGIAAFAVDDPELQKNLHIAAAILAGQSCGYAGYKTQQKAQQIQREQMLSTRRSLEVQAPATAPSTARGEESEVVMTENPAYVSRTDVKLDVAEAAEPSVVIAAV